MSSAQKPLRLIAERDFDGHGLRLHIGVATGAVAAGVVGSVERQTYALSDDTVNLAQGLEQMNKGLDTDWLIRGTTFVSACPVVPDALPIGTLQARGRDRAVEACSPSAARHGT